MPALLAIHSCAPGRVDMVGPRAATSSSECANASSITTKSSVRPRAPSRDGVTTRKAPPFAMLNDSLPFASRNVPNRDPIAGRISSTISRKRNDAMLRSCAVYATWPPDNSSSATRAVSSSVLPFCRPTDTPTVRRRYTPVVSSISSATSATWRCQPNKSKPNSSATRASCGPRLEAVSSAGVACNAGGQVN